MAKPGRRVDQGHLHYNSQIIEVDRQPWTPDGGVLVDNQTDPPAPITTIVAPGATIVGSEATLAAGTQTIRLLGPYTVNYDDPDVNVNIFQISDLADVPAGSQLIRAWAVATLWSTSAGTSYVQVRVGAVPESGQDPVTYPEATNVGGGDRDTELASAGTSQFVVPMLATDNLYAGIFTNTGGATFTEGTLRFYALIAEPAV